MTLGKIDSLVEAAVKGDFSLRLDEEGKHGFMQRLAQGINQLMGSLTSGLDEATAVIAVVDRIADCYQDLGVVAASGYSKDALPIVAGVVAVANRDRLLNPQTFLACVGIAQQQRSLLDGQGGGGLQPCGFSYSLEIAGDTYDFLYAGTDLEICQAFCRSMPGCTGHQ